MEQIVKQIEEYKKEIEAYSAADVKAVEDFRVKYLGTKGIVKVIMGEMKNVSPDKKKEFGQILNEFKLFTESKYEYMKIVIFDFTCLISITSEKYVFHNMLRVLRLETISGPENNDIGKRRMINIVIFAFIIV